MFRVGSLLSGKAYCGSAPLRFAASRVIISSGGLSCVTAHQSDFLQMETAMDSLQNDATQPMSKNAQRRLLKQQRYEAKKAEKKAQMKEHKKREVERKRKEWQEKLASVGEEEREKLMDHRTYIRKARMEKQSEERGKKMERLQEARNNGQNVVIDLEFFHLMNSTELHSLVQQITYCYAMSRRCAMPAHIWLTGCRGEMQNHLQQISGYDKWVIEKEHRSYLEAFQDQKENLVYLTADSENILDELDPKVIYIIGGLVDRNRCKGAAMKKAKDQGIKTAKLPIGTYMKMSSAHVYSLVHLCWVLTVNQVVEILLKFLETKDWKDAFFQVIPRRKRCEAGSEEDKKQVQIKDTYEEEDEKAPGRLEVAYPEDSEKIIPEREESVGIDDQQAKRQCIETLL